MSHQTGISALGANVDRLRHRLREAFQRGTRLSSEKSFDYAHELFSQCVANDPNNVAFVEAMLANLRAKFGGDKKSVPFALTLGRGRGLTMRLPARIGSGR